VLTLKVQLPIPHFSLRLPRLQPIQRFTILTAFNDNAAVTYLASLVSWIFDAFKYVVMAGAVTGGWLTVLANSPNP
jgi:hypothetical protein